jgi:signal transduction histidine kinase
MYLRSLSGRFLILTLAFVMLAEVLIFVPSIARYRENWLLTRLERSQIAALAVQAGEGRVTPALESELLATAGVFNVVLRRDTVRELVLSSPIPSQIVATYDLRAPSSLELIRDAIVVLAMSENHIIRLIGEPSGSAGLLIEVTLESAPLRAAMMEYGGRVALLSGVIAVVTAVLLFLAVRSLMVDPIRRVVQHMTAYAAAPEDGRRIIVPEARVNELREAEEALRDLQTQLTAALRQRERLAQLGGAVARVSHDLRNILSTTTLLVDRIESSKDPAVARAAPKLVASLSRAVSLCETTLAFGRAEEPPPRLDRFALHPLVADVLESEQLAAVPDLVDFINDVPVGLMIRADSEQLHRVLSNLVRNARQALETARHAGTIEVGAGETDDHWWICVGDTGPGLPVKAREHLFTAFSGGVRKGGFGLGLAIASELVRGHGGKLDLRRSDDQGTEFLIRLPKAGLIEQDMA